MWAYFCVSAAYGAREVISDEVQEIDKDVKLFRFNKIDPVRRKYAAVRESREPVRKESQNQFMTSPMTE
jgi:hypothetical protein